MRRGKRHSSRQWPAGLLPGSFCLRFPGSHERGSRKVISLSFGARGIRKSGHSYCQCLEAGLAGRRGCEGQGTRMEFRVAASHNKAAFPENTEHGAAHGLEPAAAAACGDVGACTGCQPFRRVPADPVNGSIQTDRAVPHGPPGKVRSGTIAELGRGMTVLDSSLARPGSISSRRRPQKGSGCAVSAVEWDRWRSKPRTQGGEEGREGGLEVEVSTLKFDAFKARGGLLAPRLQVL